MYMRIHVYTVRVCAYVRAIYLHAVAQVVKHLSVCVRMYTEYA